MGSSGELCAACAPHTVVPREWVGGHGSVGVDGSHCHHYSTRGTADSLYVLPTTAHQTDSRDFSLLNDRNMEGLPFTTTTAHPKSSALGEQKTGG